MEPESQNQPDIREQKIAELEAKLKRANQVIDALQQQNIELQQQVKELPPSSNQYANYSVNNDIATPMEKPQNRIKRTVVKDVSGRKLRVSNLTTVQYYGLMSLVVIFILSLFGLSSLFARQQKANTPNSQAINHTQNQPKAATNLPNKLPTPPQSSIPQVNNATIPLTQPIIVDSHPGQGQIVNLDSYNVAEPPKLEKSQKLENIVEKLVEYAKNNNLPTNSLSITLIDVKNNKIAGYKRDTLRYPASVVKLFWMVALLAQNRPYPEIDDDLYRMIGKSDNDAASRILDFITETNSDSQKLDKEEFQKWKQKRQKVNAFFQNAKYKDINISQKTFPIPQLKITEPQGRDLQIRGDNPQKPIRNKISTYQAARLMYEIIDDKAVSSNASEKMRTLLRRELNPSAWKQDPPNLEEFNPVQNFFGESLSTEQVDFISKAGWTTASRQEVAYVATPDNETRYILAIFGDDPAYGKSKKAFPNMSRIVFEEMTNK